jgi:hemerythrin-like metal-binding protein
MTWSSKYSVGVEALDNQHLAFMKALNDLHAAAMRGKAREVADPLLGRILSKASEHFAAEERLMESTRYPGLAEHRSKHQEFTAKVGALVARQKQGEAAVYTELLYFMRDWLYNHMQIEDSKYAPWLAAQGVK